MYLLFFQLDFL